jgi:26S proteasome regulatory subunit N1
MTENASNAPIVKQMALILARQRVNFEAEDEEVNSIIGNTRLSEHFRLVARELDVVEPKQPEDIYKSHLAETGARLRRSDNGAPVDSARANLASTYVNAFVNAAFGRDKLMTEDEEWVFKNKEHGMMAATASLGMVLMWDVDEGLNQLDKYFHHADDFIKAGACLGIGVVSSGVRHESDPALALLSEHLESSSSTVQCAAIVGLGIAYAGSQREDIMELLLPLVSTADMGKITEASLAALALGHIFVGTCHGDIASTILQRMVESSDAELDQSIARLMCLGLGLLFLGKTEKVGASGTFNAVFRSSDLIRCSV